MDAPIFEACVVGAGLVGSAAAKYLATKEGKGVVLVGPSEALQDSLEAFGCHADEGRITRRLDVDSVWAELATRSMARYAQIEEESGVKFHAAVGCLAVGRRGGSYLEAVAETAKRSGVELRELDEDSLRAKWPYLRLDASLFEDHGEYAGLYEEGQAGHLSPRKLVAAQLALFTKLGGTHVEDVVERLTKDDNIFTLSTSSGRLVRAKRVLVATNAFTNFHRLLPRRLALRLTTQTTVRKRVALPKATMPAVIVKAGAAPFGAEEKKLDACYVLPPVEYDDGAYSVKIGHGTHFEHDLASKHDVLRWYRGETPDANADRDLAALLHRLFFYGGSDDESLLAAPPDDDTTVVRCVIPKTPTKRPYLHSFEADLACCVGCNGYAAKSSDELGRLAASMLLPAITDFSPDQRPWGGDIPPDAFRAVFDDDAAGR